MDIEEGIKNVLTSLISGFDKENNKKNAELIEILKETGLIYNPVRFDLYVNYGLSKVLHGVFKKEKNKYEISNLFTNYKFYKYHIEKIIIRKEGHACNVDKSRWLLDNYLTYLIEGKELSMEINEKCYWKPRFGTSDDWIRFIKSLDKLYFGDNTDYLIMYSKLMIDGLIYNMANGNCISQKKDKGVVYEKSEE